MLTVLAWLIGGIVAVPMLVLAAECLAGSWSVPRRSRSGEAPPFTVLMPAHDEVAGIARAIRAVRAQLRTRDRLIVIADNCSDDTAVIAEREGATVLVRDDPERRGKGYALEHARRFVGDAPGHIVIVVDADCRPGPDALPRIAATAARHHAVVQGCYLLIPPPDATTKVRVSCFAFVVKNLVRQLGLGRLAGAAILQGSGMAFPASVFRTVSWSATSLVEDLELGLRLLERGDAVIFDAAARFESEASSERGTISQRRRWEHGLMATSARYFPRLVLAGLRRRPALLMVALDLLVPPTVLLLMVAALTVPVVLLLAGFAGASLLMLVAWIALSAGLFAAWMVHGRTMLPPSALGDVARYIVWKLPVIAQFVTNRERRWVRTEREP